MGEVFHWGGQLVVSYVLVGLAYGWTLSSAAVQKIVPDDKVRGTSTRAGWYCHPPGLECRIRSYAAVLKRLALNSRSAG